MVWDPTTGVLLKKIATDLVDLDYVAFSRDGRDIAAACSEFLAGEKRRMIMVWDAEAGDFKHKLTFPSSGIHSLAFSFDRSQLVSVSGRDGGYITINSWNINEEGSYQHRRELHREHNAGKSVEEPRISISPDGKFVISGSNDTIKLWEVTGDFQKEFIRHRHEITCIVCSPDNRRIFSGGTDGTIIIWHIEMGKLEKILKHNNGAWIYAIAISPGGAIVSADVHGTIKLWTATGDVQETFKSHQFGINCLAFSPDCRRIVSGAADSTTKLWSATGREDSEDSDDIFSFDFSPISREIVSGSYYGVISLWTATGTFRRKFQAHSRALTCVVFSPDGKLIVSGSADCTMKLWTVAGDLQAIFSGHLDFITSITFSPKGTRIISASGDAIKVWTITGKLQRTIKLRGESIERIAFSPDGRHFVLQSAWSSYIGLWDSSQLLAGLGFVGTLLHGHLKPGARQDVGIERDLRLLKISEDSKHIITDSGLIKIENRGAKFQLSGYENLKEFQLEGSHICYGAVPVLHLPSVLTPERHIIKGGHIVILSLDNQFVHLNIDQENLSSVLKV
ncbi:hypothetical protein TWF694_004690 [Orbilia ellipsospora]|uniref:Mitochondrial division protein 1 n=1 Tax=Orbilia ellipsospora TaxID=2528407 RepID=A0AAV9WY46_9PEZI